MSLSLKQIIIFHGDCKIDISVYSIQCCFRLANRIRASFRAIPNKIFLRSCVAYKLLGDVLLRGGGCDIPGEEWA